MLIPQVPLAADTPIDEAFITATTKLMVAGHVHLALEAGSAETLLPNLKPVLRTTKCRVGPFKASQADLATTYLDHGCLSVAFEVLAEDADADAVAASIGDIAEAVSTLPPSRVVIALRTPKHDAAAAAAGTPGHVATAPLLAAIASLKNLAAGFIVTVPNLHVPSDDIKALKAAAGGHAAICVTPAAGLAPLAAVEVGRLHRHDVSVIAPSLVTASNDDIATAEAAGKLDVGACIAACARSDRPDGLFTTVVRVGRAAAPLRSLVLLHASFFAVIIVVVIIFVNAAPLAVAPPQRCCCRCLTSAARRWASSTAARTASWRRCAAGGASTTRGPAGACGARVTPPARGRR